MREDSEFCFFNILLSSIPAKEFNFNFRKAILHFCSQNVAGKTTKQWQYFVIGPNATKLDQFGKINSFLVTLFQTCFIFRTLTKQLMSNKLLHEKLWCSRNQEKTYKCMFVYMLINIYVSFKFIKIINVKAIKQWQYSDLQTQLRSLYYPFFGSFC